MEYDALRPQQRGMNFNTRNPSQQAFGVPSQNVPRPNTPPRDRSKQPHQRSYNELEERNRKAPDMYINSSSDLSPHTLLTTIEKETEDINKLSLEELNRELDTNINDIILLLNRRRSLILNKKRRLQDEFFGKIKELQRYSKDDFLNDLQKANDDPLINQLTVGARNLPRMNRIMSSVVRDFKGSPQDRKVYEMTKSQEFWNSNKNYENGIDTLLKRLKNFDQELDKDNIEIYEICRSLDQIDESIRDLLVSKLDDHVHRAEPLFIQKQKQQAILNHKLQQRNNLKDEKMSLIFKIIEQLNELKNLREDRLKKLGVVFGDDESTLSGISIQPQWQVDSSSKIQAYTEFIDQLENISKMRDQLVLLEQQEPTFIGDLDRISKDNDNIFNDLVRKQSEEAKAYNDWTDNLRRRLRYIKGTEYFFNATNLHEFQQHDFKDVMKRFRDNIVLLKPLVEEDSAIRQGLKKTNETTSQFMNIMRAVENEKERRRELLNILENCGRLRADEDQKTEQLRNIELEITRKNQQKQNLEDDLDGVLGDADLNTFKKIENILSNYEQELQSLQQQRRKALKELEEMNKDVIDQLEIVKNEYDDILKEILPSNWMNTYDLKKVTDLKQMKNYLKKTFKRFGILQE